MPSAAGFYYSELGASHQDQPAVILLHGAGVNHQVWPLEMRRLAGWRILALDLPGHGQSAGPGFQTIDRLADQLAGFLDALELTRVALVGHCLGGAAALAFACLHPDRAAGLALAASAARLEVPARLVSLLAAPTGLEPAADLFAELSSGPGLGPALQRKVERLLGSTRRSVLRDDLLTCAGFHLNLARAAICCPALILAGGKDPFIPAAEVRLLARHIPDCRLQILAGAGHLFMLEEPQLCAAELKTFLNLKVKPVGENTVQD